jgi:tryptophan 6-halogenase
MSNPFKVVIVGGGTAGWMTAAYLSKALTRGVAITVIESPQIKRIGVGEATFSTIRLFFEVLGLSEEDWMPKCQATYKLAIKFVDWNREGRHFFHPFQRYETVRGHPVAEWWLKLHRASEPVDYSCFVVPALCDAQRSPRYFDGTTFCDKYERYCRSDDDSRATSLQHLQIQYPYAYHFDAQLIADFLADMARQQGVAHIRDEMLGVEQSEDGFIRAVVARDYGRVTGDLFVDCTGFRGLLINKALGEPFLSFSNTLLCDRAIALQVPSDGAVEGINPYTTATALSSGWVWDIPLFGRKGTGYVYSSAFQSPDDAEREFRAHLGPRAHGCTASHIRMRVGRNQRSWVNNCVAIGLSSGFVEPLESTGIFFIQHGIEELVNHFPGRRWDRQTVTAYNDAVAHCIDGIRDFLTLHYVASTRADTPFWKATKEEIAPSDALRERLALWRTRLPSNKTIDPRYHGFESYSYSIMLLGLGCVPETSLPALDYMDDAEAHAAFGHLRERSQMLIATLPSQYDYLRSVADQYARCENSAMSTSGVASVPRTDL